MKLFAVGLPLLAKELAEQAARPRTYVVRSLYATLLYGIGFFAYSRLVQQSGGSVFNVLGRGGEFYDVLVGMQFLGIYILMPALACGAISHEKERNSLVLLMLTRLGPTTILGEKLLGRIIPMLMFLLLCLPLLTIAYSLGGLTQQYLWSGVYLLLVTVMQVGSLAILCSTYFRTTVASFMGCYILGVIYLFTPLAIALAWDMLVGREVSIARHMENTRHWFAGNMFMPFSFLSQTESFLAIVNKTVPVGCASCICLLLARYYLPRRAFLEPRNLLMVWFRYIDQFFRRINDNRVTRGIVLVNESAELPEFMPLAWREVNKSALGAFRYLVRLFVLTEFPVIAACVLTSLVDQGGEVAMYLGILLFMVWPLAILMVSVKSASLINVERSRQTLDVLLTTPIRGRDLVQQKMRGVWRLTCVVAIPLMTIILFKWWWIQGTQFRYSGNDGRYREAIYLAVATLTVLVYLPLVAWLSVWIGLRIRHPTRAIFTALGVIAGWCVVALFGPRRFLEFLSPWAVVAANEGLEFGRRATIIPLVSVLVGLLLHVALLAWIRHKSLQRVDQWLGRLNKVVRS